MSTPSITGFHHIAVIARRDYGKAVAFYADVLKLTRRVEFVVTGRNFSLFDCGGGNYIELVDQTADQQTSDQQTGDHAESKPATLAHLALRTNDVDGMIARVRDAGYVVTVEPVSLSLPTHSGPNPFNVRIAFFDGPEGESIELFDEQTRLI